MTDTQTRRYLVNHILFETKFPLTFGLKPLEDESLTSVLLPEVTLKSILSNDNLNQIKDERIESAVSQLEALQDRILHALLFEDDISRSVFVKKFQTFVKESVTSSSRSQMSHQLAANLCPAIASLFQRVTFVIRSHLMDAISFIGVTYFADINNGSDGTRLGGSASHLHKQNKDLL